MKSILCVSVVAVVGMAMSSEEIVCEGEYRGHLQGVTTDGSSLYWSMSVAIVKTDLSGKILRQVRAPYHQGDPCFYDGTVYVPVNLGWFDTHAKGDSWVFAYDGETLEEKRRWKLPEWPNGAGGMTCANGRFFVVGGLPLDVDVNVVCEYTSDFTLVKRHVLKTGFTHMGIQTAAFEDGRFIFGIYGSPGNQSGTLECPASLDSFLRRTGPGNVGIVKLGDGYWTGRSIKCEGGKTFRGKLVKTPGFPASEKAYVHERTGKGVVRIFYEGRDAAGWHDSGYRFDPDSCWPLFAPLFFARPKIPLFFSRAEAESKRDWPAVGFGKGYAYRIDNLLSGVYRVAETDEAVAFHVPGTPETLASADPEASVALKGVLSEAERLGVGVRIGAAVPVKTQKGAVPIAYGETLRDRSWVWGHESWQVDGKHAKLFGLDVATNYFHMVEGAKSLGLENLNVIRWDKPDRSFRDSLKGMKRLTWPISGHAGEAHTTYAELGDWTFVVAEEMPNVTGFELDDYFVATDEELVFAKTASGLRPVCPTQFSYDDLVTLKGRMKAFKRPLELRLVVYDDLFKERKDPHDLQPVIDVVDSVTYWVWKAENIARLEESFALYRTLAPNKPTYLGIYLWDFGGAKPMPLEHLKRQLKLGLEWFRKGEIEGLVFLCSSICNRPYPAVRFCREWLSKHGDEPWNVGLAD